MTKDEQQILLVSLRHGKDGNIKALGVAVELLVEEVERLTSARDQFRGATKDEPTNTGHFDDALVERLARVAHGAGAASVGVEDRFDQMMDGTKEMYRAEIRATLVELASTPCDLPTPEKMCSYAQRQGFAGIKYDDARAVHELVRAHIAPILAAKDTEIKRQSQVIRIQNTTIEQKDATIRALAAESERDAEKTLAIRVEREQYEKTIELQKQRIAELEKDMRLTEKVAAAKDAEIVRQQGVIRQQNEMAEDTVSRGVYEAHVADLKTRIAELESNLASTSRREAKLHVMLQNYALPSEPNALAEVVERERAANRKRIVELEKRIAELTAPVDVDGKTPGQVNQAAFAHSVENHHESTGVPNWEIAAQAVLRAFGNGAEALRRVRAEAVKMPGMEDHSDRRGADAWVRREDVTNIIDAEIANIEGAKE